MMKNVYIHKTATEKNNLYGTDVRLYKDVSVCNSKIGNGVTIGDYSRIDDGVFGEHVAIQRNNKIYGSSIGRYSYTGWDTTIWHTKIGSFCSISWNVSIGGADHDYNCITTHSFLYSKDFGIMKDGDVGYDRFSKPCIIENDVWIATGVCVCRGVKIGNGAVIGAGAVVTKDVEPYSIVGGVPAKKIKKRFSDDVIERLQNTRWWDLPTEVIRENYNLFLKSPSEENLKKLEKICLSNEELL